LIGRACLLAWHGSDEGNEATPLIVEYVRRKNLAGLGMTMRSISAWKAEAFSLIESKFQKFADKAPIKKGTHGKGHA